jgi:hypothetical protein
MPPRVKETQLSRRAIVASSLARGFALIMPVVPAHSRSLPMQTTIRVDSGITTLINIFT